MRIEPIGQWNYRPNDHVLKDLEPTNRRQRPLSASVERDLRSLGQLAVNYRTAGVINWTHLELVIPDPRTRERRVAFAERHGALIRRSDGQWVINKFLDDNWGHEEWQRHQEKDRNRKRSERSLGTTCHPTAGWQPPPMPDDVKSMGYEVCPEKQERQAGEPATAVASDDASEEKTEAVPEDVEARFRALQDPKACALLDAAELPEQALLKGKEAWMPKDDPAPPLDPFEALLRDHFPPSCFPGLSYPLLAALKPSEAAIRNVRATVERRGAPIRARGKLGAYIYGGLMRQKQLQGGAKIPSRREHYGFS